MSVKSSLTVMFEAPFWIGVYERFDEGYYEVCKITFGSEPKDYFGNKRPTSEEYIYKITQKTKV